MFRFKQFEVAHEAAAMKVGTDGVTLGAWAPCAGRVLDVGAGCGLIGLMAAQRGAERVLMLEIDPAAAAEARENARRSSWTERIEVINADFLTWDTDEKFDNIISNPPFFANGDLAPDPARAAARHQGALTPEAFMMRAAGLLAPQGRVSVIIPADLAESWRFAADHAGLRVESAVGLFTRKRALEPRRMLFEVSAGADEPTYIELHINSAEYRELVKDFYL